MPKRHVISRNFAILLVFGRPPLVFGGMLCAIAVMLTHNPWFYLLGVMMLFTAMTFDVVDGWFAARFHPQSKLAHLAERIMDKVVYSIIFPVVALGMMWRFHSPEHTPTRPEFLHVIFVLILCVTVLVRDHFAHFMRGFAIRKGQEERTPASRLRTMVATPVAAIMYAHAFYVPDGPDSTLYFWISWLGNIPLRLLFFIEIIFLVINFGSIAAYCRKYGKVCLDELCLEDERLRRRILSVFPNALTVMNAFMGLLAIFFASQDRMREAYLLLIGAALFDKLDGSVARKLGLTQPLPNQPPKTRHITFGGILDDISDGVSFCIAPAVILYTLFHHAQLPLFTHWPYGWVALAYGTLGITRLIYFTLDTKPIPGFFKGLPTPAAALFVTAPLIMFNQAVQEVPEQVEFWGIFCLSVMAGTALLMNTYPIRYLHIGRFISRHPWFGRLTGVLLLFIFTPYFGHVAFVYLSLYVLSPLVTWKIDPAVAARESIQKPAPSSQ